MGRNIIEVIIKADDKASAQLKAIAANTKNLGSAISMASTIMIAAGAATATALGGIIMKSSEWAHDLQHVSERLGVSTEFLSQMEYALKVSGGEIGNFQIGMKLLAGTLQDAINGNAEAQKKFSSLGISIRDSSGNIRGASEMFFVLADRIKNAKTSTEAMSIATDFYGRNALTLVPLLKLGSAGIRDLMQKADSLGGTLSTTDALLADKFNVSLVDVKTSLRAVGMAIFDIYGDKLIKLGDQLSTDTIPKMREWIKENEGLVGAVGKASLAAVGIGIIAKTLTLLAANPIVAGLIGIVSALIAQQAILDETSKKTKKAGIDWEFLATMTEKERKVALAWYASMGVVNDSLGDQAEDGDAAAAAWDRYKHSLTSGHPIVKSRIDQLKEIMALFPAAPSPIEMSLLSCARATDIWDAKTMDLAGHIVAVTGAYKKVAVPAMVNPYGTEWQAGLDEFDIKGIDVARDLTQEFGGMFSQIAQKGANAAEIFDQAWRSAIGNVAARLAEMAIWKVGASILGTVLGFIPFLSGGGEVKGAASGLEAFGGTRGRDTIPTMIASGEVVMPSPTVNRLKAFLDRAEGSLQGAVNVYPLFFSGSRQDSQLAAEYIQRRLDGNSRFVIEGSL